MDHTDTRRSNPVRTPRRRGKRTNDAFRAARPAALAAIILLTACVTERRPSSPSSRPVPTPNSAPSGAGAASVPLPAAPVASPVSPDATTSARLNFRIEPMGSIPYDGQVLPLISPDGRFLVVQQGDPPTWPTMLAQPSATPAVTTRISVYDIHARTPQPVALAGELPAGAVLGRAADDRGFLLEVPQPDGSRWLARAAWITGAIDWIARDHAVNAHAVVSRHGAIAYSRRSLESSTFAMIVRTPAGAEQVRENPDDSYLFPTFSADGTTLTVLLATQRGLDVATYRVDNTPSSRAPVGAMLARRTIADSPDPALAYQIAAPIDTTPALRDEAAGPPRPVALFHPGPAQMVEFDWRNSRFTPLGAGSIAGARTPFAQPPGYFLTTPRGLIFVPDSQIDPRSDAPTDAPRRSAYARLLDVPYVPRATRDPSRPLVLLGPAPTSASPRVEIMALSFPEPEQPPAEKPSQ